MMKVEIVMDKEKILAEGKYRLEEILSAIDATFLNKGLRKISEGVYADVGTEHDFAKLWVSNSALNKEEWFTQNVKTWLWYNGHGSEKEFSIEDIKDAWVA